MTDDVNTFLGELLVAAANNEGLHTCRAVPPHLVNQQGEMVRLLRKADVKFTLATNLGNLSLTLVWSPQVSAAAQAYLREKGNRGERGERGGDQ